MYQSPFYLPAEEYKRQLNPLMHYIEDSAFFIHRVHGLSLEEAREQITKNMKPGGDFVFKDPQVRHLTRKPNQDRELDQSGVYQYIMNSVKENELIAPTMTTYLRHDVALGYPVELIEDRVKKRSAAKKRQQAAEMAGDTFTAIMENNNQKNSKITSNSYSGATVVAGTAMYNRTTHSTLTSTTRSTSAYANANNEKMLAGNRHYFNPEIVLNNIVTIANRIDMVNFQNIMTRFGILTLTRDEVFQYLLRSTRKYWRNKEAESRIRNFMEKFTELELSAVVYVGDFFGINHFNPDFVKGILNDFVEPDPNEKELSQEEATAVINRVNENILLMVIVFNMEILENKSLKDWKLTSEAITVAKDILRVERSLEKYRDFFSTFFRTTIVPTSIAYFPTSIREVALMSDTDSTIFTTQEWVKMDQGAYVLNKRSYSVYSFLTYLLSETTKHILALMSANFGIPSDRIFDIEMKNEFLFGVFVPTNNTKHYFASQMVKEGNVYKKPKLEIKGVHLKSSNNPPEINEEAENLMSYICDTLRQNKLIDIEHVLRWVGDVERRILDSVDKGEPRYFKRGQIKDKISYSGPPEQSNYKHYLMWNEIFAPKYGQVAPPPYSSVQVKTTLKNKTMTKQWLESMEDQEMAQRFRAWIDRSKSDVISTFNFPMELFTNQSIPKEVISIIDKRSLIVNVCHSLYFILETLGIYMLNEKITRLVSDEY